MPIRSDTPFHKRLKEALVHAGLPADPQPIATRIKSNRQTVHRWLTTTGMPKPEMLFRLADGLNVDPKWLITGKGQMVPNHNKLAADELDLLNQIYRPLQQRPEVREEWLRAGRKYVEFLTSSGPHNPFSPSRK